jgi:hypothetical protein
MLIMMMDGMNKIDVTMALVAKFFYLFLKLHIYGQDIVRMAANAIGVNVALISFIFHCPFI